jgi:hypothetical protein
VGTVGAMMRKLFIATLLLTSLALTAASVFIPQRYLDPRPQDPSDWQPVGAVLRRWDPCRPIRLALDPASMPDGGEATIATVTAEITAVTGLEFVLETTKTDLEDLDDNVVVVSWDLERLRDRHDGEHTTMGMALTVPQGEHIVDGWVVLHPAVWADDHEADRLLLTRHELGHLVGLGHAHSAGQVMYPTLAGPWNGGWGEGDLNGLRELGGICP